MSAAMKQAAAAVWRRAFESGSLGELGELLADRVVLYPSAGSSVVRGRDFVLRHLVAEMMLRRFGFERFAFRDRLIVGAAAVLRFEGRIEDVEIDGVDMLSCDGAGRIVELRLLIRPLSAVESVHEGMRAAVASLELLERLEVACGDPSPEGIGA